MAIKLFINEPIGGLTDQTSRLWERATISFTLIKGQRGTSQLPFTVRPGDTYQPTVGSPLYIHDIVNGVDAIAYAARIQTVERKWNGDDGLHNDLITAVSLESCFDVLRLDPLGAVTPPIYFHGMTAGQIVTSLYNTLCAGVPVTLGDIDLTAGGVLPDQVFHPTDRLSDTFTALATLASSGSTNIIWGVRHSDSSLYFHADSADPAPFTLTQYRYETGDWILDETDYRNRQLVQISFKAFSTSNRMFAGDNVSKLFRLPVPVDQLVSAMLTTGTQATATGVFGTLSPVSSLIPSPGDTFTITPPHSPPVIEDPYTWVAALDNRIRNQVLIGATAFACAQNMADAINANPAKAGITFSLPTWENDSCNMDTPSALFVPPQVTLRVRNPGIGGNGVVLLSTPFALSPFIPPAFYWEGGTVSPFVLPHTTGGTDGKSSPLNVSVAGGNTLSTDVQYTVGSAVITTNAVIPGGTSLSVSYYRLGGDTIAVEDTAAVALRAAAEHGSGKYQQLITATQVVDARAGYLMALQNLLAYERIPETLKFELDQSYGGNAFPTTGQRMTLAVISPTGAPVILTGNWIAQEIQAAVVAGLDMAASEPFGHFRYSITVSTVALLPTFVDFWNNLALVSPAASASSIVPPVGGITSATPSLNPAVPTNTTPPPVPTTGTPGGAAAGAQWIQEALGRYTQYKASDLIVDASVNTRVTSGSRPFVSGDIGSHIIIITTAGGFTIGEYPISSITGTAANLSLSPAPVGSTGGVWALVNNLLWCTTYNVQPDVAGNASMILSKNASALNPYTLGQIGPLSPGGGDYVVQKGNQVLFPSAPDPSADRLLATYFPGGLVPAPVGPSASTFSIGVDLLATDYPQAYTPHTPPGGDRHFYDVQVAGGVQEAQATVVFSGTTDTAVIWSLISSDAITTDPVKIGYLSVSPNTGVKMVYNAPAVLPSSLTPPVPDVVVLGVVCHADGAQKSFNTISLTASAPPPSGNYVAISFFSTTSTEIQTSGNASTWTLRPSAADSSGGQCIMAGGGVIVALPIDVSGNTIAIVSSDHGVTWASGTFPLISPSLILVDIIFTSGTFVAIDSGDAAFSIGCGLYTSTDGTTWTHVGTIPPSVGLNLFTEAFAIAFGAGVYVAVGGTTDIGVHTFGIASSSDLATWNYVTAPQPSDGTSWYDVIFASGQFVAVGGLLGDGPQVITSPDGATWTGRTSPLAANGSAYTGIAFGAGLYVAVSNDPAGITMTSLDGVTWTGHSVPAMAGARRVRFLNGLFVATIVVPNVAFQTILTSSDGLAWTTQTTAIQDQLEDVAFG